MASFLFLLLPHFQPFRLFTWPSFFFLFIFQVLFVFIFLFFLLFCSKILCSLFLQIIDKFWWVQTHLQGNCLAFRFFQCDFWDFRTKNFGFYLLCRTPVLQFCSWQNIRSKKTYFRVQLPFFLSIWEFRGNMVQF